MTDYIKVSSGRTDAKDQTYQDYLEIAKKIKEPGLFDILFNTKSNKNFEKTMSDVGKTKPGFRKFYKNYKTQEAKETFYGLLGALGGGMAAGVGSGAKEMVNAQRNYNRDMRDAETRGNIEEIRRNLESIDNKLK
jgi:hypothetical protein